MKKRILNVGWIVIVAIICSLVMQNILSNKQLHLEESVQNLFDINGWKDCYLVKFGGLTKIKKKEIVPEVTKEEIDQYIELVLQENAYRQSITNRKLVEMNDLAVSDYKIMDETKEINAVEDAPIRVGSGYYDIYLETAILGLEIGKEHIVNWKVPEDASNTEWAGRDLTIHIIVKELYEVIIPTVEEYALQNGFENVKEYEEHVENILLEDKIEELQNKAVESVIEEFIEKSKFQINNEVVVENAIQYYYEYNEVAYIYDVSVEELIGNSTSASDNIYDKCYKESLQEIQRYLIIGRYAKEKGIMVSESEIDNYCKDKDVIREKITQEDLIYVKYEIIEEKVLRHISDNYVMLKLE